MGIKSEEIVTISFSEIQLYLKCPFSHKLTYLRPDVPKEESPALAYGTAIHLGLQSLWDHSLEKSIEIFSNKLDELFVRLDKDKIENYRQIGSILIEKFAKTAYMKLDLMCAEFELREPLIADKVFFTGFIDAILLSKKNDQLLIQDFKSTARGWNKVKKDDPVTKMQLLLYKYFLIKKLNLDPNKIKCEFLLLRGDNCTLERVSVSSTEEEINSAYRVLIDVLKHIYKKKLNDFKNIKSCMFCRWNNNVDCDRVNKKENFVDINSIINQLVIKE